MTSESRFTPYPENPEPTNREAPDRSGKAWFLITRNVTHASVERTTEPANTRVELADPSLSENVDFKNFRMRSRIASPYWTFCTSLYRYSTIMLTSGTLEPFRLLSPMYSPNGVVGRPTLVVATDTPSMKNVTVPPTIRTLKSWAFPTTAYTEVVNVKT